MRSVAHVNKLPVGGSILFVVVVLLLASGRMLVAPMWMGWGLTLGVIASFATDLILVRGGA
jgi:hypothetical protein